ncbi:MAG: Methyltransferase type 11 [Frankiales bacterium]|nr:Methyltransferase type 11 [Frankiales bacterium]
MGTVFGEVADGYGAARPGYPQSIADAIGEYAGHVPTVVEIGGGTGLATALLQGLGDRVLSLEPDGRMAAQLREAYPDIDVEVTDFESWRPPPGGVDVIFGAMVWHWLDAADRCRQAHAALAPEGVLAVVGRQYGFADPDQRAAIEAAIEAIAWEGGGGPPDEWIAEDVRRSGLFDDVTLSRHDTATALPREDYLRLVSTFSPFLRLSPDARTGAIALLSEAVDRCGGVVDVELLTTLTLARRGPARAPG